MAGAGTRLERSPGLLFFTSDVPGLPSQAQSSPGHPGGLTLNPKSALGPRDLTTERSRLHRPRTGFSRLLTE